MPLLLRCPYLCGSECESTGVSDKKFKASLHMRAWYASAFFLSENRRDLGLGSSLRIIKQRNSEKAMFSTIKNRLRFQECFALVLLIKNFHVKRDK